MRSNLIRSLKNTADAVYDLCDQLGHTPPNGRICRRNCIVNWGGCGVYAAEVAVRLKSLGVEVWGVISGTGPMINGHRRHLDTLFREDWQHRPHRPKTVRDLNNLGVIVDHVCVQFWHAGYVWTHDCVYTTRRRLTFDPTITSDLLPGYVSVDQLISMAKQPAGWNTQFPRVLIPEISRVVGQELSAQRVML